MNSCTVQFLVEEGENYVKELLSYLQSCLSKLLQVTFYSESSMTSISYFCSFLALRYFSQMMSSGIYRNKCKSWYFHCSFHKYLQILDQFLSTPCSQSRMEQNRARNSCYTTHMHLNGLTEKEWSLSSKTSLEDLLPSHMKSR